MNVAAENGMNEAELFQSSPRHVFAMIRGYNEREKREHQRLWESARFMAFYGLVPHSKKGKLNRPSDLLQFAWESKTEIWVETPKMSKGEEKRLDAWIAKNYPGAVEMPAKKTQKNGRSKV